MLKNSQKLVTDAHQEGMPVYTGESFSRWLLNQRIIVAQRFLEKTDHPVDDIADRVGFPSTTYLRRHFHNLLNTSPSRYRREFRGR
ncbi:TPA: helix-turn-helix domain-containing protein [Enterobacter mori]